MRSTGHGATLGNKREQMEAANLEAARIILNRPAEFGGEESLAVIWARAVLSKHAATLERAA